MRNLIGTPEFLALCEVYDGPIERDNKAERAVINLRGREDKRYQKLAEEMERLDKLEEEIKEIKKNLKDNSKILIADLFTAEDVVMTRVVRTTYAVFTLSKDPKETVTPQYKKILEELEKFLAPEIRQILEELKEKFVTTTSKLPSLRLDTTTGLDEFASPETDVSQMLTSFLAYVQEWAIDYDKSLDRIESAITSN